MNKAALAGALDVWAQSRERAIVSLSRKASWLARIGDNVEADRLNLAARSLMVRCRHERARAAALRDSELVPVG